MRIEPPPQPAYVASRRTYCDEPAADMRILGIDSSAETLFPLQTH